MFNLEIQKVGRVLRSGWIMLRQRTFDLKWDGATPDDRLALRYWRNEDGTEPVEPWCPEVHKGEQTVKRFIEEVAKENP